MKITNPSQFLFIGGSMRYLMSVTKADRLDGHMYVIDSLEKLRKSLADLGLAVSVNLFDYKLGKMLAEFKESVRQSTEKRVLFPEKIEKEFNTAVVAFDETVYSEMQTKKIAIPVEKIFSLNNLLDSPWDLVGQKTFFALSAIAQVDFIEGCKSIVFEVPTAAAFHLLRCIEECVRLLYKAYFQSKPIGIKTWGILIDELRQKPKRPNPSETILDQLSHIRKNFRNPTDHPDKIYEIGESQDLLSLTIDAIKRCVNDKKSLDLIKKKGPFRKIS